MTQDDIKRMAREQGLNEYMQGAVATFFQIGLEEGAEAGRKPLLEALTAICVKCRSNEWGPDTPRKEILNWMHDHASAAICAGEKE